MIVRLRAIWEEQFPIFQQCIDSLVYGVWINEPYGVIVVFKNHTGIICNANRQGCSDKDQKISFLKNLSCSIELRSLRGRYSIHQTRERGAATKDYIEHLGIFPKEGAATKS